MTVMMMMMVMVMMMMMVSSVSANSPPRFLLDTNVGSEIVLRLTEGEDSQASILRWVELYSQLLLFSYLGDLGTMSTSTLNPFLCAADFFLQLGSCKEAVR